MPRDDQLFDDLCALLLAAFRSPRTAPPMREQVTPAGFASFLLGASVAMMLCGSMTFLIGFLLLPWVIGLLAVVYFAGVVSNLSGLTRAILRRISASSPEAIPDVNVFIGHFLLVFPKKSQ
ncbi:hypothetical protein C4D60_Mb02t02400 [Musa balbisiana]|uniref:Uncharacterized protein n=1 Tax=Musa balbisiana TaxID=52838 RepID=A0A4S8I941_MUSBA|nr:hypothetical protein C4D60_Mb02t02400 [Musa balbisiana]